MTPRAQRLCNQEYNKNKGTKRTLENNHNKESEMEEDREANTHESQHILSQAYKVMVDVPDPPREELAEDEGKKENSGSGRRKIFENCQMHINAHCKSKM